MIRRRTISPLTPQQFFNEVLLSSLFWPNKTIRLERHSTIDYRHRSLSSHISIAELYHENSKLFPQMLFELTATVSQADVIRDEFVRRRAIVVAASGTEPFPFEPSYRELLIEVSRATPKELFYAIEVRVVAGALAAAFEPINGAFQVVKRFADEEVRALRRGVRLFSPSNGSANEKPLIFVLGSFARNELLLGARGYRRTLLDAGRVVQEMFRNGERFGVEIRPIYEFMDRDLDLAMDADGVEQGTLMVLELDGGGTNAL
jgi:hypothetical protein